MFYCWVIWLFYGEFGDSMVDLVGLGQLGFAPCNALASQGIRDK
jgi:hypothetical protein